MVNKSQYLVVYIVDYFLCLDNFCIQLNKVIFTKITIITIYHIYLISISFLGVGTTYIRSAV
jgi:hypothetical protein